MVRVQPEEPPLSPADLRHLTVNARPRRTIPSGSGHGMSEVETPADGLAGESQNLEWKSSWRDEHLKWICGFANAQGGRLVIGKNDRGRAVAARVAARVTARVAGGQSAAATGRRADVEVSSLPEPGTKERFRSTQQGSQRARGGWQHWLHHSRKAPQPSSEVPPDGRRTGCRRGTVRWKHQRTLLMTLEKIQRGRGALAKAKAGKAAQPRHQPPKDPLRFAGSPESEKGDGKPCTRRGAGSVLCSWP